MGNRFDALKRVFAFLWVWIVGSILLLIVGIVGFIWGLIDVIWQGVTGRDGLSEESTPAMWISGIYVWHAEQQSYATTGTGELALVPAPG